MHWNDFTAAIRDVESELAAMKVEHHPLPSHIFVSRRYYRSVNDTKSGKRREMMARLSFNTACELGFRGSLDKWERLMGRLREGERCQLLSSPRSAESANSWRRWKDGLRGRRSGSSS